MVLEQLELRLARAEWLLVCGPSGAGKSSLLRLLAGLDGPAQGTMTRLGNHVSPDAALPAWLHGRVALLGQNPEHHFIASTVAEDIAWGLLRRGVEAAEARRRSREMATALRIEHLLERSCHQLSFGEQRRVALFDGSTAEGLSQPWLVRAGLAVRRENRAYVDQHVTTRPEPRTGPTYQENIARSAGPFR